MVPATALLCCVGHPVRRLLVHSRRATGQVLLLLAMSLLLGVPLGADGREIRTIASLQVQPVVQGPTIDGRLDEPAWAQASIANIYYEYFKPNPSLGELNTDLRMVYDAHGLYIGIINHEPNPDLLRITKSTRDAPRLWQDDCAELYFDPRSTGVAFRKFTVNAHATRSDSRRTDVGVTDENWSGYGWRAATTIGSDRWIVEIFVPWSDLGATAHPGDVWRFNHTRYAWTTGKFRGVTWAAGANYNAIDRFGYLCFVGDQNAGLGLIARQLSDRVDPPWFMVTEGGIYVCRQSGQVELADSASLTRDAVVRTRSAIDLARTALAEAPDTESADQLASFEQTCRLIDEHTLTPAQAVQTANNLAQISDQAQDIYWHSRTRSILNQTQ